MELWESLDLIIKQLNEALSTLRQKGIEYCEANRKYQLQKTKEIMRLKQEGTPITLIPQMVKGLDNVADLDFDRNVADVVYKANMEAINVKKLELKVIEKQIEREYGNDD